MALLGSIPMVAVVLVATDLAGATNLAIDIRVGPFAPEESKKNEGGSCLTGRDLPLPLVTLRAASAGCWRWLLAALLPLCSVRRAAVRCLSDRLGGLDAGGGAAAGRVGGDGGGAQWRAPCCHQEPLLPLLCSSPCRRSPCCRSPCCRSPCSA